jgi:hypothetical protein
MARGEEEVREEVKEEEMRRQEKKHRLLMRQSKDGREALGPKTINCRSRKITVGSINIFMVCLKT